MELSFLGAFHTRNHLEQGANYRRKYPAMLRSANSDLRLWNGSSTYKSMVSTQRFLLAARYHRCFCGSQGVGSEACQSLDPSRNSFDATPVLDVVASGLCKNELMASPSVYSVFSRCNTVVITTPRVLKALKQQIALKLYQWL